AAPIAPLAPRPATARAEAPKPAAGEERGPGWLSDLLARASKDDASPRPADKPSRAAAPPRPAQPVTPPAAPAAPATAKDSLESISANIARMIDHQTAVSVWERYYRGDQNVFSRKLYTAQGQQTFEDIRRRYRADAEFREVVDRYCEEFERLLQDIGRDDRDGSSVRGMLTSDTGKVYTLLAHAADRFDGA
ncbi:MAG TPA: kinesin, partial [Beijerinckiaceae bacterium]